MSPTPAPWDRGGHGRGAGPVGGTGVAVTAVWQARAAQPEWRRLPPAERLAPVSALRAALAERSAEAGAVAAGAEGEGRGLGWGRRAEALSTQVVPLADACAFLEQRAAELLAPRRPGRDGRPGWLAGVDMEVVREPFGVVLVVAPASYPLFLPGVQVLQALVAGNAVVLKPGSGGTPAARWLADRLAEGGLPEGLLGVLPEDAAHARRALAAGVDKVVLTGSSDTGATLLAELAPRLTPATLELSGSDALIALDDADPELVADALAFGLRLNRGATCIAPRRALVHRAIFAAVVAALARRLEVLGPVEIGPLPPGRAAEADHADRLVAEAVEDGARLLAGGGDASGAGVVHGPPPRVVVEAARDAELRSASLFAPVLTLDPVDSAAEAKERANASPYGLGASVFGGEAAARALAGQLDAGVVTVNDVIVPTADPRLPFGGRRSSGYGVTRGAEGLLEMTAPKAVAIRRRPRGLLGRFLRPHLHFEAPRREDEALITAWLRFAHGGSWRRRLAALPGLLRALRARARAGKPPASTPSTPSKPDEETS